MATTDWPSLQPPPADQLSTIEERDRALASACRAAMQQLPDAPDREAKLRRIDPLPQSSIDLLARLPRRDG